MNTEEDEFRRIEAEALRRAARDDDIVLMADASGLSWYGMGKDREKFIYYLGAFAALVAEREREACAKIAEMAEPYKCADLIRARGEKA